ncbi:MULTISPECIES: beta strand repeat-containing protein [unclassified Bradyrhizobium]
MSLTAGSIAFTGFNGDGNDNLSFVALTDIPQGTVINFTDSNWNGTSFSTGSNAESTIAWTATSAIPAGTVIDINNIGKGTFGTSAGSATFTNANNTGLSNDSEVVYAYIGTSTAPTFLAAISNVGYATSDGTLTGTGLIAGQTAVSFTGGLDIVGYNGPRAGLAGFADYLAAIGNTANWQTQNGSGDQSADGNTPDAPFPTTAFTLAAPAAQLISFSPSSVLVAEGDSGTKTMTFVIVRSGSTTGVASFSGTFAAGTTNAADYGGTLPPVTFNGTIADGATSATVTVTISGDTTPEADESFTLTLTSVSNPSAAATIGTATATGTITNDDSSTPITLANNDHHTILSPSTLSGSTPVTWIGGSTSPGALLENFGNIIGTSRAIATSGSASGSFTVNNGLGATITATKDAVKISNLVTGTSGTFTLNNQGTISSTGTGSNAGQALDLDDINSSGANTVINNAAGGVISAADADAIRAGAHATINNNGRIVSQNASASSSGNDAIDFQSVNTGGVVNNFGGGSIIDGARHGITGDQPITITNDGTIIGRGGSGINMDSAANTTTTVTNRGTITGTSMNGADADGIDVDGLVSIDNFGMIWAVGLTSAANGLNEALAIGGGFLHNEARGGGIVSDQRAITVDDSNGGGAFGAVTIVNDGYIEGKNGQAISITGTFANTIANSGYIVGSIAMGDGNDGLSNRGVIKGDVSMGAGDDSITLVNGLDVAGGRSGLSGTIDGGAGTDTISLSSTGVYYDQLGTVINVENLHIRSGNWGLRTLAGFSDIKIESGTTAYFVDATPSPSLGAKTIYNEGGITAPIRILGDFDDIVTNKGGIKGGVFTDGGADTLINSGMIVAYSGASAVDLGDGDDTFTNSGVVSGNVTMGAGNDTIDLFTGSTIAGMIDGGDGNDTINLSGLGSWTLGMTIGIENLDVRSGNWATSVSYAHVTVETGASLVLGGQVSAGTVAQGAALYVYGRADGATVRGEQWVVGGGKANGTILDGGSQNVYGAVVTQTTIGNGAIQYLHGSAITTILNDGGAQNVYSDGTATGTTVNVGGVQNDWGTASGTRLEGGAQYVFGSASTTTLNSGLQFVENGGAANTATIHGGNQVVFAGGTATGTTMDGGSQEVYGAVVTQTTIGNGAIQHLHGSAVTTILNSGGAQNVYADGTATGTTVNAGGVQVDWGVAGATIVNGGVQYVYGSAAGTTVLAGTQYVQSGGSADDTTIGSGALAFVHSGGAMDDVIFAGPNASLVLAQASALTGSISGWQDHDSIDLGDILFGDGVTSFAYAQNSGNTGGTLTVSDGTHTASLSLLGQYSAADFALSSDGHGGTLISDPGAANAQQQMLVASLGR